MLYKEFIDAVDVYNSQDFIVVQKFVRKTTKESVKQWQRSMDFVREGEGAEEDWQRLLSREIDLNLFDWELGYGFTKKAIQDATAGELRETTAECLRADQRLLAKLFFQACLVSGGFWDAAMATAPPNYKGNAFAATHTHYGITGAAALRLQDLTTLKQEIREHGYMGQLYLFVNSATVQALEDLAGWTAAMTANSVVEEIAVNGLVSDLKVNGFIVIPDDWVPANYLFALDGSVQSVNMREPLQAAGRGLKLFKGPYEDYPLMEATYERRCGMNVVHRGAGAVLQIAAAGAYTNPTFSFVL